MADSESFIKPQPLISSQINHKHPNPCKFYNHFLFKAFVFAIFLVVIPVFPSQAPDFVNHSIFTQSWELLHLIFVGIVVSYGLFSRKNDESEGEKESKFDNAQNYVSKLLQVSSVFDDEVDSSSGCDESKVQTWSSLYFRNEPPLIVAKGSEKIDEKLEKNPLVDDEKPLLLPVRSLKSRVSDEIGDGFVNGDDSRVSRAYKRSNSSLSSGSGLGSRESSRSARNGSLKLRASDVDGVGGVSGDGGGSRSYGKSSSSSSLKDWSKTMNRVFVGSGDGDVGEGVEESVVLRSPIPWRSRSGRMERGENLNGPFLRSVSPSMEEIGLSQSLKSRKSRSSSSSSSPSPTKSSPRTSYSSSTSMVESQAKSVEDAGRRRRVYKSSAPPPPPPPPPRPPPISIHKPHLMKSSSSSLGSDEISAHKVLKRSIWSEPLSSSSRIEANARNSIDSSIMGKSVRTIRTKEIEDGTTRMVKNKPKEVEPTVMEEPLPKTSFSDCPKETQEFLEHVLVETDSSEGEDDNNHGGGAVKTDNIEEATSNSLNDEAPDVDKKADEFIAKFREQIRLQRIESIKRSTGQLKRDSTR